MCKIFRAGSGRFSNKKLDRQFKVEINERRSAVERQYHGHPHGYERDGVAFRQAQVRRFPRLTRPATAHSYDYERNPETDTYRRHPLAKAHDNSFRHDRREESFDAYDQDLLIDQHHYYRQEPVVESHTSYRRDGLMDHDDLQPLDINPRWDDEIRNHRSYDRYPSYCDPDYRMIPPERWSAEYSPAYDSPKYHSSPGSLVKYRSTSGPLSEYRDADSQPRYRLSTGLRRSRR